MIDRKTHFLGHKRCGNIAKIATRYADIHLVSRIHHLASIRLSQRDDVRRIRRAGHRLSRIQVSVQTGYRNREGIVSHHYGVQRYVADVGYLELVVQVITQRDVT